jgi:hypothetical protein
MMSIHAQPRFSSLPTRTRIWRAKTAPTPFAGHGKASSTRTSSSRNSTKSGAYQPYVESTESLPVFKVDPAPSTGSRSQEPTTEDDNLLGPTNSGHARTISPKSSYESSIRATSTIYIKPSRALQAMQSVGIDTGHEEFTGVWRHSDRYVTHSQTSLLPEVYKPSGLPPHLHEELDTANQTSCASEVAPRSRFETFWEHESEGSEDDDAIAEPWTEPAPFGPSNQDIEDLIERQNKYDEAQKRKALSPLKRFANISKEFTGGLVRTLSKGPGKRAFEPRAKQARTASQEQPEEAARRPGFLRRYHTVGGSQGRVGIRDGEL